VRWTRRRWRSIRQAGRKRSIRARVVTELRNIDKRDPSAPDAEIDQVVRELFSSVSKSVPSAPRGKPSSRRSS
jgi:hypothetical protein